MHIGLTVSSEPKLESLRHLGESLRSALAVNHELLYWPNEITYFPPREQRSIVDAFLQQCDVVVGFLDDLVLDSRQRTGRNTPCVFHLLGGLPRGAFGWRSRFARLSTSDVLIANCTSDVMLTRRFLRNARVQLVPLAYDARAFYGMNESDRQGTREALGFTAADRLLLYAGRITTEKNVHGLLRVFRVVMDAVADAHLLLVGRVDAVPFHEFGATPCRLEGTMARTVERLGIPPGRVHLAGATDASRLCALYNAADAVMNLTLHHDENFGLAQVEAMACGTPVVGAAWGGLKDTILDGTTGAHVSTLSTPSGVRLSWWEAANKTIDLLCDPTLRSDVREACLSRASTCYSPAAYQARMDSVVAAAVTVAGGGEASPLEPTDFASEFWSLCDPGGDERPPYRRGKRSMELYGELVDPYTGAMAEALTAQVTLESRQVLTLAVPVVVSDGLVWLNDPMYPIALELPPETLGSAVEAILSRFSAEPALEVGRLQMAYAGPSHDIEPAVRWLLDNGVLLRSRPVDGWVDATSISPRLATPLFVIHHVSAATDLLVS